MQLTLESIEMRRIDCRRCENKVGSDDRTVVTPVGFRLRDVEKGRMRPGRGWPQWMVV